MAGSALIGNLAVNLSMETAAFQQGASIAEKRAAAMSRKLEDMGAKITRLGAGLTLGITGPLAAFGKKAIDVAQDAEEMESSFNVVFGNMSGSVRKWAEATGNAMGRSTQEMQRGALAFQELFGKALDPQKSTQLSKTFAVLTQDLASFKNLSNEVAQQKLLSGLAGEAEPLRAVGVFLSEAKVQAQGLAMGLGSVNGKLSEEEKIIARAAVIQRELAKANGDVERTAGSAANKSRELAARYEEVTVSLGTKLLPLKVKLAEIAIKVLDAFSKLSPSMQTFIVGAGGVAAAIGPVMLALGPLLIGLGKMGPLLMGLVPIMAAFGKGLIALAIAGGPITVVIVAAGALYLAFKNWEKIGPMVQAMVASVTGWLGKLNFNDLKARIKSVENAFATLYDKVVGHSYVPDMVEGIAQSMSELQRVMVDPALSATQKVGAAFQSLAGTIGSLFGSKAGGLFGAFGQLISALSPVFGGAKGTISESGAMWTPSNPVTGVPLFARGGAGVFGGMGGIDRNVLSLNGSPIARVSRGEHFRVSPANDKAKVEVVPSPYFSVVVRGEAATVAAPMAGHAAMMGAAGGDAAVQRRMARRIP